MEYRPTPYMASLAARLERLSAKGKALTPAERREAQALNSSLRWARNHWLRYRSDPAYREAKQERARNHWRANYGSGGYA